MDRSEAGHAGRGLTPVMERAHLSSGGREGETTRADDSIILLPVTSAAGERRQTSRDFDPHRSGNLKELTECHTTGRDLGDHLI